MTNSKRSCLGPLDLRSLAFGLMATTGVLDPAALQGQLSSLQLEVNGGASIPVAEFAGVEGWEGEAAPDVGFGVHFALTRGHVGYLVGFSEHRFRCPAAGCGAEIDLVSTAWDVGLRLNLRRSGVVPWLGLGAVAAIVQADVGTSEASGPQGGTVRGESERGWGLEAGGGVLIPVADGLAVNPGVRYGRVDLDLPSRGVLRERYLVVDLGFVLGF